MVLAIVVLLMGTSESGAQDQEKDQQPPCDGCAGGDVAFVQKFLLAELSK